MFGKEEYITSETIKEVVKSLDKFNNDLINDKDYIKVNFSGITGLPFSIETKNKLYYLDVTNIINKEEWK